MRSVYSSVLKETHASLDQAQLDNGIVAETLRRIDALVLLEGSVRPRPLTVATGRSVLDLPLDTGWSLLDHWREQSTCLAAAMERSRLRVAILLDRRGQAPRVSREDRNLSIALMRDLAEYRGTGGVLCDLFAEDDSDGYLLVANAAQMLLEPLDVLAGALAAADADVSLVAHSDGTPSGLMLLRSSCLRSLPRAGYVDMKEQALGLIAANHTVKVVQRERPAGLPVRDLETYVAALRTYHMAKVADRADEDPFAEVWQRAFSVVEEAGTVDPGARLHDSVVLRGCRVEEGSIVVRSLVCPGAFVRRRQVVVDSVVGPTL